MPGFKGGRGGKSFGPKRPWKGGFKERGGFGGGDRGFERKEMHDAVCSECGDDCQVPFRPNGTKPVKCRNCFKVDDKRGGFGGDRGFGEKRPYSEKRHFDRPQPMGMDTKKIENRLGAIEEKLDALLEALSQKA